MADFTVHLMGDEPEQAIIIEGAEIAFNAMGWLIFHKERRKEDIVAIFNPGIIKYVINGMTDIDSDIADESGLITVN
jgi:hypothetical protein